MINNLTKTTLFLLASLLLTINFSVVNAQNKIRTNPDPSVITHPLVEIERAAVVNMSDEQTDWAPMLKNVKKIHVPGVDLRKDEFLKLKAKANRMKREAQNSGSYDAARKTDGLEVTDPPIQGTHFFGNGFGGSIPNDNGIAISKAGEIVSVINSSIYMYNSNGVLRKSRSLAQFVSGAGIGNNGKFDPKATYDPIADRFIVVFLNGASSSSSTVVVCFSQTNDPTGNWNIYGLSGNVGGGVWTDFPQIGMSQDEFFITGNLFANGGGGQGAAVWQIEKADGYAGTSLTVSTHQTNYFSLHPVEGGINMYGPNFFLVRSATGGGSKNVWVHQFTNTIANAGVLNTPVALVANLTYTLPPDADQKGTSIMLQSNDCRVQSSYIENNRIQWACNTSFGGRPSAYYGTIILSPLDLNFSQAKGNYISYDGIELAYPSLAYGGAQGQFGDNASFVAFNYCSNTHYASNGAAYIDTDGSISDYKNLRLGSGPVGFSNPYRWGDYADIAERHDSPGEAWVGGSYATGSGNTRTYISQLLTPPLVAVQPISQSVKAQLEVYPNPTTEFVNFIFDIEKEGNYTVKVLDMQGKVIQELLEDYLRPGVAKTSFATTALNAGTYIVVVYSEGNVKFQEKFLVAR